jgi:hypothetical protein
MSQILGGGGGGGGAGTVTHTGNLTSNHVIIGNGTADEKVDSALLTDGAGALSGATSVSTGTAPTACGSSTGCFAATEAGTAGTPTAGQDYFRADSTAHSFKASLNGGAEFTALVAPGTSGNVLTSDGTNWTSAAAGGGAGIAGGGSGNCAVGAGHTYSPLFGTICTGTEASAQTPRFPAALRSRKCTSTPALRSAAHH